MYLRSDIHKYLRNPRHKKIEFLLKMQPDQEEPKRGTVESFFGSCSYEKKKGDISTSTIDESLQINRNR